MKRLSGVKVTSFRVFEVGTGADDRYQKERIPTARYLDTNDFEKPPFWKRLNDDDLFSLFERIGISSSEDPIVLYGKGIKGILASCRIAVILIYAGMIDVHILDGGFCAWQSTQHPIESGRLHLIVDPAPRLRVDRITLRRDTFFDFHQVKQIVECYQGSTSSFDSWSLARRPSYLLVCIRNYEEYIGQSTGYSYISTAGHIPTDVWGHSGCSDPDHMEEYLLPDGALRPLEEITQRWQQLHITKSKHLVFYCGTAWRSSLAFLVAYSLRWPTISVYDGGWLEWSSLPDNPIESNMLSSNSMT